jgi:hypothetical protein
MVQYPTTQVQDGMPKPQIPLCVQRLSGLWYCYDDQGNLVYIGNSPTQPQTKTYSTSNIYTTNIYTTNILCNGNNEIIFNSCGGSHRFGWNGLYNYIGGTPWFGFLVYVGSVSVPVGTSNTYGSTITINNNQVIIADNNYYLATLPVYITVTWGGTFASGETVNVQLTFNISQAGSGSTSFSPSTTLSATATGSQSLNINNIIAVIAPAITTANTYYTVSSVTAAAASSASSTSVTVSVQAWILTS